MSLSSSLLSYTDCTDFMDRATEDPIGARKFCRSSAEAHHFRMRVNYTRKLHRDDNKVIYSPGDPMHGKSEYDQLMLTIRESPDGYWVYARKMTLNEAEVEALSTVPDEEPPAEPTLTEIIHDDQTTT